jgi:hypothetical protein
MQPGWIDKGQSRRRDRAIALVVAGIEHSMRTTSVSLPPQAPRAPNSSKADEAALFWIDRDIF